jgi:hypothetical protein
MNYLRDAATMAVGNGTSKPTKRRTRPSERAARRAEVRNGGRGVSSAPTLLVLEDLDQRTRAAKLARQYRDDLISDLGGEDRITSAQNALAQRAATLHAVLIDHEARYLSGAGLDLSSYLAASGEFRRVAMCLGIAERYAAPVGDRPPTLEQRAERFFASAGT